MSIKQDLRQTCLAIRRALPPDEVVSKSQVIVESLRKTAAFQQAQTVLCYISSKDNEVDTHAFITSVIAAGQTVLAPITESHGILKWARIESLDDLAPTRCGILEPKPASRNIVTPPPDALVIVPGIAFSPDGFRIGYGGGYYDRFLAKHEGISIGLAFELQIVPGFPHEAHDMAVNFVVTEETLYQKDESA